MKPILVQREQDQSVWSYPKNRGVPGALRLIDVWSLLRNPERGTIKLLEFKDLKLCPKRDDSLDEYGRQLPDYAAISHVWKPSPNTVEISEAKNRPLVVKTGDITQNTISWYGLVEAANAAAELNCRFLWLDLLCLDQQSDQDKKLQIKNMANVYTNAASVIVMVGGVAAAQRLDRESTWINRAWTFQEATLCQADTWVLVKWDLPGSFSGSDISIRRVGKNNAIVPLERLVHCAPGQGFGVGQLKARGRKCEVELKQYKFRCLSEDPVILQALAAAMDSIPVEDDFDSTQYGDDDFDGYENFHDSKTYAEEKGRDLLDDFHEDKSIYEPKELNLPDRDVWGGEDDAPKQLEDQDQQEDRYGDGSEGSGEDSQNSDQADENPDDISGLFAKFLEDRSDDSRSNAGKKRLDDFIKTIHQCAVWRSMWLRTSTKRQDMVFSMMHFFSLSIAVDYKRSLDDLVFELIRENPAAPAWLAMGFDYPVDQRSGLIPQLPQFTPNSEPIYIIDGKEHHAGEFLCSEYYCSMFDLEVKSTTVDGHNICAIIMEVASSTPPVKLESSKDQFAESDLHLSIPGNELDISCRFKGKLGQLLVVLGAYHRREEEKVYYASEGYPWVFFLDKTPEGSWQKVGGGLLDEPLFSVKSDLWDLPKRHVRVGGSPGAEIQTCTCADKQPTNDKSPSGSPVRTKKEDLNQKLIKAAFNGSERNVRDLIKRGADVNAQTGYWNSALEAACRYGHRRVVLALLQNGAPVDVNGGMPLYIACEYGFESIASLLLSHGAKANTTVKDSTPLFAAVRLKSSKSLVELLVKHGADVNFVVESSGSRRRATPLMVAIKEGSDSASVLIENGADVNVNLALEREGVKLGTPLQLASALGNITVARLLLENGADPNATGGSFHTALQAAAYEDRELICRTLVANGADVNAVGGRYGCAIQAASSQGNIEVVCLLLNNGADVNIQGGEFGTALQAAAASRSRDNFDTVRLLLRHGADTNAKGGRYDSPMGAARHCRNRNIVKLLEKHGAEVINMDGIVEDGKKDRYKGDSVSRRLDDMDLSDSDSEGWYGSGSESDSFEDEFEAFNEDDVFTEWRV